MLTTVSSAMVDEPAGEGWRLVAVGALIQDLTVDEIARYASAPQMVVAAALAEAAKIGVVHDGSTVDPGWAVRLVDGLDEHTQHMVQTSLGRRLLSEEPEELDAVLSHCRAAAPSLGTTRFVDLAEHAGRLHLSTRRYATACQFLRLAVDLSDGADPALGERLLLLARAVDGTGDLDTARELLTRAVALGTLSDDPHLVAQAAVHYALPSDWFGGDHRAVEVLRRADAMALSEPDRVMVTAARGLVEMRIPVVEDDTQYAWITRPDTAHPITDAALDMTSPDMTSPEWLQARATALIAWRASHRAPRFLERRREVTIELVDLAHQINDPWKLVMGAEWAAVDAIESADRAAYDRYVALGRWAAEHDGNPRLRWRAAALAAGSAYLDGNVARASDLIDTARSAIAPMNSPCWMGAEMLFVDEEVLTRDDPDEFANVVGVDSVAAQLNPLAQAGYAYMFARLGDVERGQDLLARSWRALDSESSMLLHTARLASAAIALNDQSHVEMLIDILTPLADHVVVDAHGWWIDGPVTAWLARLHAAAGRPVKADELRAEAVITARSIQDVRTLQQLEILGRHLAEGAQPEQSPVALGDRELEVLRMMADGLTNAEIAKALSFSVSTIRNSTVAIYRAFGVKGRADSVATAHRLGLLDTP